jgi:hypothetical protein
MLKARRTIAKLISLAGLFALALASAGVRPLHAHVAPNDTDGPYGFTTMAVTFGGSLRTARLTVRNRGDEPVLARLQFVDEDGKVLIRQDSTVKPGKDTTLEFNGTGGVAVTELKAQFGTNTTRSIGLLRPRLEIIDSKSGKTVKTIGSEGFAEFKPAFDPSIMDAGPGGGPH